jgi:hypothetical protein
MTSRNYYQWIVAFTAVLMFLSTAPLARSGQTSLEEPRPDPGQIRKDSNFGVTLKPETTPVRISEKGGSFGYRMTLENDGKTDVRFSLWAEMSLPDGEKFGPVLVKDNLRLNAGSQLKWDSIQEFPREAPPGSYLFRLTAGIFPSVVFAQDEFSILKIGEGLDKMP